VGPASLVTKGKTGSDHPAKNHRPKKGNRLETGVKLAGRKNPKPGSSNSPTGGKGTQERTRLTPRAVLDVVFRLLQAKFQGGRGGD